MSAVGYVLDKHYALPPINLSAREAALLVALGTQAIQLRWLPFTETVQAALDFRAARAAHHAARD